MTKEELSQVYYLDREIKMHKRRLYALREQLRSMRVVDGVSGSDEDEPCHKRNHIVRGVGPSSSSCACVDLITKRKDLIAECQIKCETAKLHTEQCIAEIPDSLIRQIFILYYVDLHTWREVAQIIGGNNTMDGVRMTASNYLKNN